MDREILKLEYVTKDTVLCDKRALRLAYEAIHEELADSQSYADDLEMLAEDFDKWLDCDDAREILAAHPDVKPYLIEKIKRAHNIVKALHTHLENMGTWAEDYVKSDDYNSEYAYLVKEHWEYSVRCHIDKYADERLRAKLSHEHYMAFDNREFYEIFDEEIFEAYEREEYTMEICDEYDSRRYNDRLCLDGFLTAEHHDQMDVTSLLESLGDDLDVTIEELIEHLPSVGPEYGVSEGYTHLDEPYAHLREKHACLDIVTHVGVRCDYVLTEESLDRAMFRAYKRYLAK
jgi:hypothetical protein